MPKVSKRKRDWCDWRIAWFNKSIKNLATIDDKINTVTENYEPKTKVDI